VKARPFLQGAGLAVLFILPVATKFLSPSLNEAYHHPHPIYSVPMAILAMTLVIWLLAWIVFLAVERLSEGWRNLFVGALALLLVGFAERFFPLPRHPHFSLVVLRDLNVIGVLLPFALIVCYFFWRSFFARCIAVTNLLYAAVGFSMIVLLPRLAMYAFRFEPPERTSFHRSDLPPPVPDASRIVWILMDELSYDQTFDHRQPDVVLPHLDAFAKGSVSFSNLQPIGRYTEHVVPGLLLGTPIHELKTPFHGPVSFRHESDGSWETFDPHQTIFGEARKLNWTTGIAGWYNPYCRLFSDVLDSCSWQYSDNILGAELPLSYNKSVAQNMLALLPLRTKLEFIFHDKIDNSAHRRDYKDVMTRSKRLLRDRRIRFVLLHMPIPHPPGIYDRTTHQLSDDGSYLDNLVLADDSLGSFMEILRSIPDFENTSVIVSSDHSWRTFWWKESPLWSAEAISASHGGTFDPRPVLMVHLAGMDSGQIVKKPVNMLVLHPILESLLHGQICTPADLAEVVNHQPQVSENVPAEN
jgi:sulfatase-like protein